jgi:hypothetical protein
MLVQGWQAMSKQLSCVLTCGSPRQYCGATLIDGNTGLMVGETRFTGTAYVVISGQPRLTWGPGITVQVSVQLQGGHSPQTPQSGASNVVASIQSAGTTASVAPTQLRSGNPKAPISLLAAAVYCAAVGIPEQDVGTLSQTLASVTPAEQNNSTLAMANASNNFTLIFNTLHY